ISNIRLWLEEGAVVNEEEGVDLINSARGGPRFGVIEADSGAIEVTGSKRKTGRRERKKHKSETTPFMHPLP
ncbi:hypothetical protein BHM03_00062814, partial [Ensete ventricosum]